MAASPPTSLSLALDSTLQHLFRSSSTLAFPSSRSLPGPHRSLLLRSLPHFSSPSPPPATAADSPPRTRTTPFLDENGIARLQTLEKFQIFKDLHHGQLEIRPMDDSELEPTVQLLAESFAEAMWMPASRYVLLFAFLVRLYVLERRNLVPHAVVLVGLYTEKGAAEAQLACTAEVSFDSLGMNVSPPTPLPPKDGPYICNMTVKKSLRRKKIGWHLLEACEVLMSKMTTTREVYLHCRVTDTGPYHMYKKAGYKVLKTDSILVWLSLQRRKYLMCKELGIPNESQSASDSGEFPHG